MGMGRQRPWECFHKPEMATDHRPTLEAGRNAWTGSQTLDIQSWDPVDFCLESSAAAALAHPHSVTGHRQYN